MSKKTIYSCDICTTEFSGSMSLYLFNDIMLNEKMEQKIIPKEEHYCDPCTRKIVEAIFNLKQVWQAEQNKKKK